MATLTRVNIAGGTRKMAARRPSGRSSFSEFMQRVIARKTQLGKAGTAQNYRSTLNSFMRFVACGNVRFSGLTPSLIEEYEAWLMSSRVKTNSISFYMRNLRAAYNHAVELGLTADRTPFKKPIPKSRKRPSAPSPYPTYAVSRILTSAAGRRSNSHVIFSCSCSTAAA